MKKVTKWIKYRLSTELEERMEKARNTATVENDNIRTNHN
jgi:hypothetical protein